MSCRHVSRAAHNIVYVLIDLFWFQISFLLKVLVKKDNYVFHDKHHFLIFKDEAIKHPCFLSLRSTDNFYIAFKRPLLCLFPTIEAKFYQFNWSQINI